jgi:hemolysin III
MAWPEFREPVSAGTHLIWMILSVPMTVYLWHAARGDWGKRIGFLIFGGTAFVCFGGSFLYHSVPASEVDPFAALDHIGIYLFIAGTVTPIALVALRGWWRITLLTGIWMMAAVGVGLRLGEEISLPVATGFYLLMGWIGCLTYFELVRRLSHAAVRPIWLGGLFYTVGAAINALQWPVLAPGLFGAHELFHLFVMAGSACHFQFMHAIIVPYRGAPEPTLAPFPIPARRTPCPQLEPSRITPPSRPASRKE